MRITQGAELDLVTARLEAMRAAGGRGEAVFSVPEEPEEEPAPASARRARDERERDRDRSVDRDVGVERPPLATTASVAVGAMAPPPAPAESTPAKLDREPGRADVKGGERPGAAPAEGRADTEGAAGSKGSTAASRASGATANPGAPASGAAAKASPDGSTREPEVAAKSRVGDALPPVDGAAPAQGAGPEAAAASAARAPAEAVATAAARAAVEAAVTQAVAPAAQAATAPGPKVAAGEPALPGARAGARAPAPSALPTVPGALPTVSQRQSDNGLTPVKASAPGAPLEGADPLRARLQDALRSSINQRVMQESASGEVVLPGLGRVAVSARTADAAVAVEVHAAQAATARLLHASAGEIAADVIAADIPLSTLSFGGAGSWSQADPHAPPPERDGALPGVATDEAAPSARSGAAAVPAGRVRIVL